MDLDGIRVNHAGLDQGTRMRNQDRFLQEDGVVMTATVAFEHGSTTRVRICRSFAPSIVAASSRPFGIAANAVRRTIMFQVEIEPTMMIAQRVSSMCSERTTRKLGIMPPEMYIVSAR